MTREDLNAYADQLGTDLIVMDGFDNCILGVAERFNETFVLYDYNKVIETLMANMSHEEAIEYYDFNIAGAYIEGGPAFIVAPEK